MRCAHKRLVRKHFIRATAVDVNKFLSCVKLPISLRMYVSLNELPSLTTYWRGCMCANSCTREIFSSKLFPSSPNFNVLYKNSPYFHNMDLKLFCLSSPKFRVTATFIYAMCIHRGQHQVYKCIQFGLWLGKLQKK